MGFGELVKEVLIEWYENRILWYKKHTPEILFWGTIGILVIIGIIMWIIGYR